MRHIFSLCLVVFSFQCFGQLIIAPTRLVVDDTRTITEEFIVENTSNNPIRLEIDSVYKPISNTEVVRNHPTIHSIEDISDRIRISPPVIRNLKPDQRRTIRVQISTDDSLAEGEYRTYLRFSPTEKKVKNSVSNTDSEGIHLDLHFAVESFIPIYLQNGQPKQQVEFTCSKDKLVIANTDKFQFNAWIESSLNRKQKIVLLRESTQIKTKKHDETLTVSVDDDILFKCL
ncbi:molecular chaperone [Vibrio ponticus]|uniref:Molecular chaperone n=1 Tax=Vibrio ponticus TaxID=265668 RepID=A0A3N3DZR6_9VIBR|nr:molecular chaperone [Vibrio ponticus]ROV59748.1 molecular chaperone [Vibrio ponticus]